MDLQQENQDVANLPTPQRKTMRNLHIHTLKMTLVSLLIIVSLPLAPVSEGMTTMHGPSVTSITSNHRSYIFCYDWNSADPITSHWMQIFLIHCECFISDFLVDTETMSHTRADSSIDSKLDKITTKCMPESNVALTGPVLAMSSHMSTWFFAYVLSLSTIWAANNAGFDIELDSVRSSTSSLSVSSASHSLPQLNNTPANLSHPVKKARLSDVAVVGSGVMGKYNACLVMDITDVYNLETLWWRTGFVPTLAVPRWISRPKSLQAGQKKIRCS